MTNEKGQALIETALVLLFLLFILFGIVEYGRFFFHTNTMKNAAREGARLAVVTPNLTASASTPCPAVAPVGPWVCSRLGGLNNANVQVNVFQGTTSTPRGGPAQQGDRVEVIVTWDFDVIGLVPFLDDRTITTDASMRYE